MTKEKVTKKKMTQEKMTKEEMTRVKDNRMNVENVNDKTANGNKCLLFFFVTRHRVHYVAIFSFAISNSLF